MFSVLFVMLRRPPRSTRTHTLSLHVALPIVGRLGRDRPAFILPGGLYSYADYIHRLSPADWIVKPHGATSRPKYIRPGKDCLRNVLHRYPRPLGPLTAITSGTTVEHQIANGTRKGVLMGRDGCIRVDNG